MITGLPGVLPFAPRPGWKEVVTAAAAMPLGAWADRTCPPDSSIVLRVAIACGAGGLIAMLVGSRDSFQVPQLVFSGVAGSLAGVLFARLAVMSRPSL